MLPEDRLRCQLIARQPAMRRALTTAHQVIADALDKPGVRWHIAFSGGIDSTVMLDLIRQHPRGRAVDVIWGDNGWDLPETLAFLDTAEAHWRFRLKVMRTVESFQDFARQMGRLDLADNPNTPGCWGNPQHWDGEWWEKDSTFAGYDGVFLGLLGTERKRGGESRARTWVLKKGYRPTYQVTSDRNVWHCSPLASWTKHQVWAYAIANDVPYNDAYDILARLGVPMERRRVSELTCYRAMQYGTHVLLRSGWPDLWNRFTAVFPDVRSYA